MPQGGVQVVNIQAVNVEACSSAGKGTDDYAIVFRHGYNALIKREGSPAMGTLFFCLNVTVDGLVKTLTSRYPVIPVKTGVLSLQ